MAEAVQQQILDFSSRNDDRFRLLSQLDLGRSSEASRIRYLLEIIAGIAGHDELTMSVEKLAARMSLPGRTLRRTVDTAEACGLVIKRRTFGFRDLRPYWNGLAIDWDAIRQRRYRRPEEVEQADMSGQLGHSQQNMSGQLGQPSGQLGQPSGQVGQRVANLASPIVPLVTRSLKGQDGALAAPGQDQHAPPAAKPPTPARSWTDPASMPLPEVLDCDEFRAALVSWFAQRRRRRLSTRKEYIDRQLDRLVPLGPQKAAECLRYTVDQDYQGIFPEKFGGAVGDSTTVDERVRRKIDEAYEELKKNGSRGI